MTKDQLRKKIARLESINDYLASELSYLNELMKSIGFAEGISTVKITAQEMLSNDLNLDDEDES